MTDKLITLSTCNSKYGLNGDNRLLVVFKHIDATTFEEAQKIADEQVYTEHEVVFDW